jgi:hypothetical protein
VGFEVVPSECPEGSRYVKGGCAYERRPHPVYPDWAPWLRVSGAPGSLRISDDVVAVRVQEGRGKVEVG